MDMDLRKAIEPKSDQLNADDLVAAPITVTVERVTSGNKEQPINVFLIGMERPWRPCKSMLRVLVSAWSDDAKNWTGKNLTLFCDPEVKWAGVKVGGIRISHMSDISSDREFMLTASKGSRKPFLVRKLAVSALKTKQYPEAAFKKNLPAMLEKLASGEMTKEQIIDRCEQTGVLTEDQKAMIKLPETTESGDDNFFGE